MKKTGLLFIGSLLSMSVAAQDGYTIFGKLCGITTDKVHMVTADFGCVDTLASATIVNDAFVLSGTVPGNIRMVNLVFNGIENSVPLMLEDTLYQMQVTAEGAAVNGGGEAAKLYNKFNRVAQEYAAEQETVMTEYSSAKNDAAKALLQTRLDAAYKISVQKTLELIRSNPDSYVSAYVVAASARTDGEELARQKYELLSDIALETVAGKAVEAAMTRYDNLTPGKPAPDFTVKRPNGDDLTLSAVPAKIKLIVFWASWDAASRQINPELITIYQQFRPKGFEIISISLDDNRFAWERAIEQDGISIWFNGSDLLGMASPLAETYMLNGTLLYTVLVDADGNIAAKGLLGNELREAIAELAQKKKK